MINEYFNPVKEWHAAMNAVSERLRKEELAAQEAEKLKRKEQARKTTEALLAKNPNHFKELAALSNANRKRRDNYE